MHLHKLLHDTYEDKERRYIPRIPSEHEVDRTSWTPRSVRPEQASERPAPEQASEQLYKKDKLAASFPTGAALLESSRGAPSTRPTAITDRRRSLYYASAKYLTDGNHQPTALAAT